MQPAGGVEEHGVAAGLGGFFERVGADVHRVHIRRGGVDGHAQLTGQHLQLLNGGRAVHVGGDEIGLQLVLGAQQVGQLARRGGFARTLQADHHDDDGPVLEVEARVFAAEQLNELIVDDLDHLLTGREALEHVGPERLLAHAVHELLDDLEIDVGLKQGQPHFAQPVLDVFLIQPGLTAQVAEGFGQAVGKTVEHGQRST